MASDHKKHGHNNICFKNTLMIDLNKGGIISLS